MLCLILNDEIASARCQSAIRIIVWDVISKSGLTFLLLFQAHRVTCTFSDRIKILWCGSQCRLCCSAFLPASASQHLLLLISCCYLVVEKRLCGAILFIKESIFVQATPQSLESREKFAQVNCKWTTGREESSLIIGDFCWLLLLCLPFWLLHRFCFGPDPCSFWEKQFTTEDGPVIGEQMTRESQALWFHHPFLISPFAVPWISIFPVSLWLNHACFRLIDWVSEWVSERMSNSVSILSSGRFSGLEFDLLCRPNVPLSVRLIDWLVYFDFVISGCLLAFFSSFL